eukprot:TRINITY_DN26458_c0_g1_i1.p1 TRINITY_DN26458_c0_g1~~TRINITY_DN26458_c0_g1_i1.p1  ORF type:complete len:332 (-),score=26.57 TRINITY_DN26458_c0_g1_i1:183-1103(-)
MSSNPRTDSSVVSCKSCFSPAARHVCCLLQDVLMFCGAKSIEHPSCSQHQSARQHRKETCTIDSPCAFNMSQLSEDSFKSVMLALTRYIDSPALCARLSCCSKRLHVMASDATFIMQCSREWQGCTWASGEAAWAQSWEQLAVQQAVHLLHPGSSWRVQFVPGQVDIDWETYPSGERLRPTWLPGAAELMRRHPKLRADSNGHACIRTPPLLALDMARGRAAALASEMESLGVESKRIRRRGWGSSVAPRARWKPGRQTAVAELFLIMDNKYLPPRPSYYAAAERQFGDMVSSGSESDVLTVFSED